MDQSYMKERSVMKLLLTMSLPMMISMLVNSLYNIVDSFFVAKISEDAMTALSLVFPMLGKWLTKQQVRECCLELYTV